MPRIRVRIRVNRIRDRLPERLKGAEQSAGARGGFDVCREGAEDPVEGELAQVAGAEDDDVGEVGFCPLGGVAVGGLASVSIGCCGC